MSDGSDFVDCPVCGQSLIRRYDADQVTMQLQRLSELEIERDRTNEDLEEVEAARVSWKTRYEEQQQRITALEQQLAETKPYREFVEAMLKAAESQDCADCPTKCVMPDCYCDQAADAWHAWQERKGK